MTDRVLESLGVEPVVNAVGPATRLASSVLSDDVVRAMADAARVHVRMHELQSAAGAEIAGVVGGEAGYVTSGAAAGLLLAAAACMAGDDPAAMNRLPDTEGMRNEIVIHRAHRNPYDRALRAAGAKLVEVGFAELTHPYEIESAIGHRTAAVAYVPTVSANVVPLHRVAQIAHAHGVPVIVDASLAVPPLQRLRDIVEAGADLVAVSGGKWIGGPAASGLLVGRADLIRSVALQQQDQDTRIETWHGAGWIADGTLPGPPHQGIGRATKVGKEEVAGLIAALRAYAARDHEADQRRWRTAAAEVVDAVAQVPGVVARVVPADGVERGWPIAELQLRDAASAYDLVRALAGRRPAIEVDEALAWRGVVRVTPTHLLDGEAGVVAAALVDELTPTGPQGPQHDREDSKA